MTRAIAMLAFGDEDAVGMEDVEQLAPAPSRVLVRVGVVEASSLRDSATSTGRHPFSVRGSRHVLGAGFAVLMTAADRALGEAASAYAEIAAGASIGHTVLAGR